MRCKITKMRSRVNLLRTTWIVRLISSITWQLLKESCCTERLSNLKPTWISVMVLGIVWSGPSSARTVVAAAVVLLSMRINSMLLTRIRGELWSVIPKDLKNSTSTTLLNNLESLTSLTLSCCSPTNNNWSSTSNSIHLIRLLFSITTSSGWRDPSLSRKSQVPPISRRWKSIRWSWWTPLL